MSWIDFPCLNAGKGDVAAGNQTSLREYITHYKTQHTHVIDKWKWSKPDQVQFWFNYPKTQIPPNTCRSINPLLCLIWTHNSPNFACSAFAAAEFENAFTPKNVIKHIESLPSEYTKEKLSTASETLTRNALKWLKKRNHLKCLTDTQKWLATKSSFVWCLIEIKYKPQKCCL